LLVSALALSLNRPDAVGQEAVNPVDDGVSFDSYANGKIPVEFLYEPVILGEEIIIVTGQLDPYHPGEYLEVEIYTPQGEVIVSERINEKSPTWPGYIDDTGFYRFKYNPMDAINSTETIEGTWAVRLSYGEAKVSGYIVVDYFREENVEEELDPETIKRLEKEEGLAPSEQKRNPKPVNPVDDGVTVLSEPVYNEGGKAIGFIPSGLVLKGAALDSCEPHVARAFYMLADVPMQESLQLAKGPVTFNRTYAEYVDKYAGTVNCRDNPHVLSGNAMAYVSSYSPNTINLNPVAFNNIPDMPTCERGTTFRETFPGGAYREIDCDLLWNDYNNDPIYLAGILVHEATHSKQFDNPILYIPGVHFVASDSMEWRATLEQANALRGLNYTFAGLSVEETYESFLLYRYEYYYDKSMPADVYKKLFGKEPQASTQSLTTDIPQEVEEELEKQIEGHSSPISETETNTTGDSVRSPTEEDLDPELTEENFDEYENPKAENPVDDGVTVLGDLPVPVEGSLASECRDEFVKAFDILQERDNASYAFVNRYLTEIQCEEDNSGVGWNGVFRVGQSTWDSSHAVNLDAKLSSLGAILVHESCHVEQFERQNWFLRWIKWQPYGEKAEVECMAIQLETLNNLGYESPHLERMVNDPEYRKDHKYWEQEDRYW
jgi:hypothetical protein